MNRTDAVWAVGRLTIGAAVKIVAPLRVYGAERVPLEGGLVVVANHFSWVDPPALGAARAPGVPAPERVAAQTTPGATRLTIRLKHLDGTLGQGLGRFRLSVTSSGNPAHVTEIPARFRHVLSIPAAKRTDKQRADLADQFRASTPLLADTRQALKAARKELAAPYREVMGSHFPAMALVEVRRLVEPQARLEIEATAVVP